jgi:hypothetical protein
MKTFLLLYCCCLCSWVKFGSTFNSHNVDLRKLFPSRPFGKLELYPYPHMKMENFLDAGFYKALEMHFPKVEKHMDKLLPGGHYVRYRSQIMDDLMTRHRAWAALDVFTNSSAFTDFGLHAFRDILKVGYENKSCTVDPDQMKWHPYNAADPYVHAHNLNRSAVIEKKINHDPKHDYNRVFSRVDLIHGFNGVYQIGVHNDFPHCIWNLIIYLDDLEASDGGEFVIHDDNQKEVSRVIPKRNSAVFFLNGWNNAYHASNLLNSTRDPHVMKRAIQFQMCTHQAVCRSF